MKPASPPDGALRNYDFEGIWQRVNVAIGVLFEQDSFLLENGANERSVSHKFAECLQKQFPDWNVDCEYNRKGEKTKKMCDGKRRRIYPDIIIHKRGKEKNLLVIEMKTKPRYHERDKEKCKKLTSSSGDQLVATDDQIGFQRQVEPFQKLVDVEGPFHGKLFVRVGDNDIHGSGIIGFGKADLQ